MNEAISYGSIALQSIFLFYEKRKRSYLNMKNILFIYRHMMAKEVGIHCECANCGKM